MNDLILEPQKENKPLKFIMHLHTRGRNVHTDLRLELNDHLISFTLDDPVNVSNKSKLSNDANISSQNKILIQLKTLQPKQFLTLSGEIPAGSPGSTKNFASKFQVLDRGYYELGIQRPGCLELFLQGSKFKERFLIKKIERTNTLNSTGKKPKVLLFYKPINQNPDILSEGSIEKGFVPPVGISALSDYYTQRIPPELRWWEKNIIGERAILMIKEIRKNFLKRQILTGNNKTIDFTLKLKEDKKYQLSYVENDKLKSLLLSSNPIEVSSEIITELSEKELNDENNDDVIEKGKLKILQETNNFTSFELFSPKLKGTWILKRDNNKLTLSRKEEIKQESKLKNTTDLQRHEITTLSKDPNYSLSDIAKEVGCSKSTVRYQLRNMSQ